MTIIGVLFDIDALGGGFYGTAAYKILFDAIDRRALRNVRLYDGDTAATLSGKSAVRLYCIAVESPDSAVIRHVEARLAANTKAGLHPANERFLRDAAGIKAEPLVFAGAIDANGVLSGCDTPWISDAWTGPQKTAYDVVLKHPGPDRSAVMKEVRALSPSLGMGEAKALVEGAPRIIAAAVSRQRAQDIVQRFEALGADMEIA